jgi:hypothetical protein
MSDVTPEQARDFFRAAASFSRQAPRRFASEGETSKVESQQLECGPWYAMVLGGTAKVKGLILCDDRKCRVLLDRGLYQAVADRLQDITVHFGDRKLLHPDDLAVAKRYGFEGDGPKADPMAFRTERGRKFRTPKAWELELLEACLRVIPDFLKRAEDRKPEVPGIHFQGSHRTVDTGPVVGADRSIARAKTRCSMSPTACRDLL